MDKPILDVLMPHITNLKLQPFWFWWASSFAVYDMAMFVVGYGSGHLAFSCLQVGFAVYFYKPVTGICRK